MTAEALATEIGRHMLNYNPDGSPSCSCDGPWGDDPDGHWFAEHIAGAILARLSVAPTPGLDEERLAGALDAYITGPSWQGTGNSREFAESLATEYARLARPEGE